VARAVFKSGVIPASLCSAGLQYRSLYHTVSGPFPDTVAGKIQEFPHILDTSDCFYYLVAIAAYTSFAIVFDLMISSLCPGEIHERFSL
jgi:hypothetical protein